MKGTIKFIKINLLTKYKNAFKKRNFLKKINNKNNNTIVNNVLFKIDLCFKNTVIYLDIKVVIINISNNKNLFADNIFIYIPYLDY